LVQAPLTETVVAQKFLQNINKNQKQFYRCQNPAFEARNCNFPAKTKGNGMFGGFQPTANSIVQDTEIARGCCCCYFCWYFFFCIRYRLQPMLIFWLFILMWFFLTAQHFKPRKTKMATVHSNSHFNKDNLQDT
jgi:hypothetical protein